MTKSPKPADENAESDSSYAASPVKKKIKKEINPAFELTWPEDDTKKLIARIEEHIPPNDLIYFKRRVNKLPWDEIQFGDHTPKECHQMWALIQQRIRGFRTLPEVIEDAKIWITKPWTNLKRSKSTKHPAMPKQPLRPYFIFCKQQWPKVSKEFPSLHMPEIAKIVGEMYKKLPEKKMLKLKKKATILKAEYERQLKEFYELYPDQVKPVKRMKAKRVTAFNLFLEDCIKNTPDYQEKKSSLKSISKEVRQKWNELSDDEKVVWIEKAQTTANLQFAATAENLDILPDILVLSKKERRLLEKARNKKDNIPQKPPGSLYRFYIKKLFKDNLPGKKNEIIQQLAEDWKKLSVEEKKILKAEYDELKKTYNSEYARYSQLTDLSQGNDSKKKKSKKKKAEGADEVDKTPLDLKEDVKENDQLSKKSKRKISNSNNEMENHEKVEEGTPSKKKKANDNQNEQFENLLQTEPKQPPDDILKYYSKIMKKKMKIRFKSEEELSEAWENLDKKERKSIKKEYKALKQQYIVDYKEFLDTLPPKLLKKYMEYKNIT